MTRAVDADMIIMIGASTIRAKENATPYAARLNLGSAILAITAAISGPSVDIISHVAANGSQNLKISFCVGIALSPVMTHKINIIYHHAQLIHFLYLKETPKPAEIVLYPL